jgi:hypothetical protein
MLQRIGVRLGLYKNQKKKGTSQVNRKRKELLNKMEQLENNTNKTLTSDLYSLTVHA